VLIARTSGFLLAGKVRSPDALFGDLHALDALEAKEQFDEVHRRFDGDPLDDRPERLLHVLAEATPLIVRPLRFTFTRWFGSNTPEPPEDHLVAGLHREGYGTSEPEPTIQHHRGLFFPARRNSQGMVGVAGGLCNGGIEA